MEMKKLNPRIREWEMATIIPGNRKGMERKFGLSEVVIKYHVLDKFQKGNFFGTPCI